VQPLYVIGFLFCNHDSAEAQQKAAFECVSPAFSEEKTIEIAKIEQFL
jgi:hypothetical protein